MKNPFEAQSKIPGIRHILLVGSGKGGVGKSTLAVNLAMALKKKNRKVGLLDGDLYGPSVPRLMGAPEQRPQVENSKLKPIVRYGLKFMSMGLLVEEETAVIWRGPMLFKALEQFFRDVDWGELDELIIDLPPGTGDVALTVAQKVPVQGALIVCTPQNLALLDAKKAIDMFEKVKIPLLGVVENMSYLQNTDGEKIQLFAKGQLDSFLKTKNILKLGEMPFNPAIGLASEAGIPFVESEPQSPEALAFEKLAENVMEKLKASPTCH